MHKTLKLLLFLSFFTFAGCDPETVQVQPDEDISADNQTYPGDNEDSDEGE